MNYAVPRVRWEWSDRLTVALLVGYMILERAFAHLGVRPVFIGDIGLVAFLLLRTNAIFGQPIRSLFEASRWSSLAWCMLLSIGYGTFEMLRGLASGHLPAVTLQCLIFNVYPLFLWAGVYLGRRHPQFLSRVIVPLAVVNGLYGLLFVFVLSPLGLTDSLEEVEMGWFGQPNWTAVFLLALIIFQQRGWLSNLALVLNGFILLALQSRASWVGLAVAVPLWIFLSGRVWQAVKFAAALALLLAVGWITDVRLPPIPNRGGQELSVRALAAQAWAIFDPKGAEQASPNLETRAATVEWRETWWKNIWGMVHQSPQRALFGAGYGYPIWTLNPFIVDDFPLRTPHNVTMFALGYTGWVGVALFYALMGTLWLALWRAYRRSGNLFGLCLWAFVVVRAQFDNLFETPHLAIPFFLLAGLCLAMPAPATAPAESPSRPALGGGA
ncbi:MAG TPA: O-antigen ligase family protein [Pirellulales bacterium]|jgi:O-antigen ligase|nr:O-antigen ligase family protein [Pirellulales bacterium]